MSLLSKLQGLLGGGRSSYALVWREYTEQGSIMRGEPIAEKSDSGAITVVRTQFMHVEPTWMFWALFRPNDSFVTAEQGPKFGKWLGDFAHVASDSHVTSTLASIRRHRAKVARPLHKVRLQSKTKQGERESESDA